MDAIRLRSRCDRVIYTGLRITERIINGINHSRPMTTSNLHGKQGPGIMGPLRERAASNARIPPPAGNRNFPPPNTLRAREIDYNY